MAHAYGRLPFEKTAAALKQGELWLKEHGRSPMLLLTLGRLCRRARLWGKARIYFESSLGVRPLPETYGELAGLLEQMGDTEAAQQCYRKGLKLAVEHPRDVPEPMTAEPAPVAGLLTAVPGGRA
jgi:HemY protein